MLVTAAVLMSGSGLAQPLAAPSAADAAHNASALTGPLAVGATVRDPAGQTLGRITRLTTGPDGRTLVMLRKGVDSFTVPADVLHVAAGEVVSSLDRDGVKKLGDIATH
jgi:hypothetical protein